MRNCKRYDYQDTVRQNTRIFGSNFFKLQEIKLATFFETRCSNNFAGSRGLVVGYVLYWVLFQSLLLLLLVLKDEDEETI